MIPSLYRSMPTVAFAEFISVTDFILKMNCQQSSSCTYLCKTKCQERYQWCVCACVRVRACVCVHCMSLIIHVCIVCPMGHLIYTCVHCMSHGPPHIIHVCIVCPMGHLIYTCVHCMSHGPPHIYMCIVLYRLHHPNSSSNNHNSQQQLLLVLSRSPSTPCKNIITFCL